VASKSLLQGRSSSLERPTFGQGASLASWASTPCPKTIAGQFLRPFQPTPSGQVSLAPGSLFEVFFGKCDANVAFIVCATEWAAQAAWPSLKKVDECFESDFQAGYFFFQFLLSHVSSWIGGREREVDQAIHPAQILGLQS
jgi:hypothetical protein